MASDLTLEDHQAIINIIGQLENFKIAKVSPVLRMPPRMKRAFENLGEIGPFEEGPRVDLYRLASHANAGFVRGNEKGVYEMLAPLVYGKHRVFRLIRTEVHDTARVEGKKRDRYHVPSEHPGIIIRRERRLRFREDLKLDPRSRLFTYCKSREIELVPYAPQSLRAPESYKPLTTQVA